LGASTFWFADVLGIAKEVLMKSILPITFLMLSALSFVARASGQDDKRTVLVADTYYWAGPEGNLGIAITGKFQSEQKLLDTLNPLKEVGSFKDREYPFNERLGSCEIFWCRQTSMALEA